jgi:23S rRNA pseudouridine2605 synthase
VRLIGPRGAAQHGHIAYYKPAGQLTTRADERGRSTVFESVPRPPSGRWIAVGRLDINTSGLLLLTTDGELAHRLMHPRYEVSRGYAVRVLGSLADTQVAALLRGVMLEDGPARFESIHAAGGEGVNRWYRVTLKEGRKREVRRMFEAIGMAVSRLIRIQYGPVELGKLSTGQSRPLEPGEVRALYSAVGLEPAGSK